MLRDRMEWIADLDPAGTTLIEILTFTQETKCVLNSVIFKRFKHESIIL